MTELITASGKDQLSISKDPFFFSTTDLHSLSSDINQKGNTAPLTEVSVDYDNELRDQINPPDIGCDEFGPGGEDFAIIGVTPDVFKYKKQEIINTNMKNMNNIHDISKKVIKKVAFL